MKSWAERWLARTARKLIEIGPVLVAIAYALVFMSDQCAHWSNPWFIESDARATTLPAWRYHGTGLFPDDLTVDYMNQMYFTWGCRVLFWIGTLFGSPIQVARVLPLLALAFCIWQAACFAHKRMGWPGVALAIFAVVHTYCIWYRLVGFNSRAFGYPLTFAFIRYLSDRNEPKVLLTLAVAAVCYPAALLLLWPAYVLVLLATRADRARWLRTAAATLVIGAFMALPALRADKRIGRPPTYAQAATLRQMGPGGFQPFYPLGPALPSIRFTWDLALAPAGEPIVPRVQTWVQERRSEGAIVAIVILAVLAGRRLRRVPVVFPALVLSGFAMFAVISAVAYRLYLPDRPLTYAFPSVMVLGLPLLAREAFRCFSPRPDGMAAKVLVAAMLLTRGDGLVPAGDAFIGYHTPYYDYFKTLPKDVLIAGPPATSQLIQTFAQRKVLFADGSNTPFYYAYAVEMERRMEDFFRAYYARDWQAVRDFSRRWKGDYLCVNESDFGASAMARVDYTEPWGTISRELIQAPDPRPLVLGAIPPQAIAFRDGPALVVDLHRI